MAPNQHNAQSGPFEVKPSALRAERSGGAAKDSSLRSSITVSASTNVARFDRSRSTGGEIEDDELCVPSIEPPLRRYDCPNYEVCLDLAAALNWGSFTCRGCCGEVNQTLYWRAHQSRRKDAVAKALCELPPIVAVKGVSETEASQDDET